MGNCLGYTTKADLDHSSTNTSGTSKTTSKSRSSTVSSLSTSSYGNNSEKLPLPISEGEILSSPNLKAFTYNDLKSSTKNFENRIGEGGFGIVYKGWMDINTLSPSKPGSGIVVAIKKLKPEGFQGHAEWLTEIKYLSQLHHPNLVKLIGYCLEGENCLLVYEFMPKGSLENHLIRKGIQPLSWAIRIKIAMDAARGLSILHNNESQVICRDVKSSNILLDGEFNAKLSDFGLAKAGPTGDRTHVSTRIIGTHGYAAPEYLATGRLTWKCDVYSFGVVLLELLTGRPAMERTKSGGEQSLVDWVKHYMCDSRKLLRIIDIKLEGQYPKKGAEMLAALASQCLSEEPKLRPRMTEVLITLEQIQGLKSVKKSERYHQKTGLNHIHKSPLRYSPSPRRVTK